MKSTKKETVLVKGNKVYFAVIMLFYPQNTNRYAG